jgi:hypothetical protein
MKKITHTIDTTIPIMHNCLRTSSQYAIYKEEYMKITKAKVKTRDFCIYRYHQLTPVMLKNLFDALKEMISEFIFQRQYYEFNYILFTPNIYACEIQFFSKNLNKKYINIPLSISFTEIL